MKTPEEAAWSIVSSTLAAERAEVERLRVELKQTADELFGLRSRCGLGPDQEGPDIFQRKAERDADGWLYQNPDTGIEWSEQHPVRSGEVPDAENVRPATADALRELLLEAWSDRCDKAQAWDKLSEQGAEIARLTAERDEARRDLAEAAEVLRPLATVADQYGQWACDSHTAYVYIAYLRAARASLARMEKANA